MKEKLKLFAIYTMMALVCGLLFGISMLIALFIGAGNG